MVRYISTATAYGAVIGIIFLASTPAFAAKRELLLDVPNTTTKDLYIQVGKRWSGEGMRGRDGMIYAGKNGKSLMHVVATCAIDGGDGWLPVRQVTWGKSPLDPDIHEVDLDQEPIRFLVLAHKKLCQR